MQKQDPLREILEKLSLHDQKHQLHENKIVDLQAYNDVLFDENKLLKLEIKKM